MNGVLVHTILKSMFLILDLRLDADVDLAVLIFRGAQFEEAAEKRRPLQDERREEEVEADAAVTVALQERHEKAEANEHHHVDILENCSGRGGGGGMKYNYTCHELSRSIDLRSSSVVGLRHGG